MATSSCIEEIEKFIDAKINYEFANHEKSEHEIKQENLPDLARDIQITRNELNRCLIELKK
jgi:hypothetical protein